MIEYRFKVVDAGNISFELKPEPVVVRIAGDRKTKVVRIARTFLYHFRAHMEIGAWDKMAHTPQEAIDRYKRGLTESIEAREAQIVALRADLYQAESIITSYCLCIETDFSGQIPPLKKV